MNSTIYLYKHYQQLVKFYTTKNPTKPGMNITGSTRQEQTPSEKSIRRSVNHYIDLAECAFKNDTLFSQHDALCQLLIKIMKYHPGGTAPKPISYQEFPQVHLVDPTDPSCSRDEDLNYKLFLYMYHNNINFCDCMEVEGDLIYYFTLSIWYEVCSLRERMDLYRIKYNCYEYELTSSIKETSTALMLLPSTKDDIATVEPLPHFSMEAVDEEALGEVLQWLLKNGWICNNVTLDDWLYRLTGKMPPDGAPSPDPIKFSGKSQCAYVVKGLIFRGVRVSGDNWNKAKVIFSLKNGNILTIQKTYKQPSGCMELSKLFQSVYKEIPLSIGHYAHP